jgi:hypothetical protein
VRLLPPPILIDYEDKCFCFDCRLHAAAYLNQSFNYDLGSYEEFLSFIKDSSYGEVLHKNYSFLLENLSLLQLSSSTKNKL